MAQRYEAVRVTPELAKKWLADPYERQRSLSNTHIANLARAMSEGRWFEPGLEPIAFTPDGKLLNGQHRLLALVKANMTLEMMVAYDADPAMFPVIDIGRRRSAYQFVRGTNKSDRASIARLLLWYDKRRSADRNHLVHPVGTYALSFDNDEVLAVVEGPLNDIISQSALDAKRAQRYARVPASTHGAVLVIARRDGAPETMISDWVDGVAEGVSLAYGDPRLLLRNRMMDPIHGSHTRRSTAAAWMLIVRAFNAFAQGRNMRSLIYVANDPPPPVDARGTASPSTPSRPRKYRVRELEAQEAAAEV